MELLANWLVQGSLVALATACVLQVLQRARAHARYWVCAASWAGVLVLPLISTLTTSAWPEEIVGVSAPVSAPLVSMPQSPTTAELIAAAWCIWIGVHLIRLAGATVWVRRVRRGSRAFPSAVSDRLCHWARVREEGRRTRLVVSDDVRAAAVIGCGAPVIAVSPTLIERLTADELDRVVIHEWAHVQRRDDILDAAQLIARLFAGWHPALWWLGRQLHIEREAACDETAVRLTGSSKRYATCLLKLAELPVLSQQRSPALGMLSSPAVATRIRRIVTRPAPSPGWSTRSAAIGIALVVAVSCVAGSLRVVHAARVPLEPSRVRAIAHHLPARPVHESRGVVAAAPDPPSPVRASQLASRPAQVVPAAPPRVADPPAPDPAAGTAAADAPHAPAGPAVDAGATHPDEPVADASLPAGSTQEPVVAQVSPWVATANAGVSLGKQSKKGGVATAAFFTRIGKRIAGSF